MKYSELQKLENKALENQMYKYKKESFNLRFQRSSGVLENTSRFRFVRKSIARIKTILNSNKNA